VNNKPRREEDPAERIRDVVRQLVSKVQENEGLSLRQISHAIGANDGWLHDYLLARIKWLSPRMKNKIESYFHLERGSLGSKISAPSTLSILGQLSETPRLVRDVTIIASRLKGGFLTLHPDEPIGTVERPPFATGTSVKAIRAHDDPRSRNRFRPGEVVFFDENMLPLEGGDALVQLAKVNEDGSDGWLLRRYYAERRRGKVLLESYNDEPEVQTVDRKDVLTVYAVVGIGIRSGP
jgi:hypothetical protein